MQPNQRVRDGINRLGADSDFSALLEYLSQLRDARIIELEDATQAVHVHKGQGYCQALRDVIDMCRRK